MTSPVSIEVEGVPLKHSLYNCLKQLGLAYSVKDGFVMISAEWSVMPVYDDPFLIVGHCLLALIAAGLGGVLGPLASGRIKNGRRNIKDSASVERLQVLIRRVGRTPRNVGVRPTGEPVRPCAGTRLSRWASP